MKSNVKHLSLYKDRTINCVKSKIGSISPVGTGQDLWITIGLYNLLFSQSSVVDRHTQSRRNVEHNGQWTKAMHLVISVCFYHIRQLLSIHRRVLHTVTLLCSLWFILSRLDYSNSLFACLVPRRLIENAATRLISWTPTCSATESLYVLFNYTGSTCWWIINKRFMSQCTQSCPRYTIRYDTISYARIRYINVRSKADEMASWIF